MSSESLQKSGLKAQQRPTLKTIAELSGFGIPTISRALNDSPEISEETKLRVQRIATEVGYIRDRAGLRLKTGQTNVICLAFVIHRDDQMGELISAIATGLRSTPFQIAIAPVLPQDDCLTPIQQVVDGRLADAVIFNETFVDDPRVKYLLDRGFPFATHGRNALSDAHPFFDFDNEDFARKSVRLLAKRSRRNIALLGPPQEQNYGRDTFQGAHQEAALLGLGFFNVEGACSNEQLEIQLHAARRFVRIHPECDGFICSSSRATMVISAALEEVGRKIGCDVDVIAKGSRAFLNIVRPAIIAIEEDVGKAADFLSRAVLQSIQAPERPPLQECEVPDFSDYDL